MIHRWNVFDLEIKHFLIISMIRHPRVKLYHLKPQTLKHVEIMKVSEKPIYDASLESF